MTKDKKHDDALIDALDEKIVRACYEHFQHYAEHPCSASAMRSAIVMAITAITEPPAEPKPDRWTLAWGDAERASLYARELNHNSDQAAIAVLRKHFPERPAVVVPFGDDVIAAARFYADVPVAESRIVIMANAILDGAKGGE